MLRAKDKVGVAFVIAMFMIAIFGLWFIINQLENKIVEGQSNTDSNISDPLDAYGINVSGTVYLDDIEYYYTHDIETYLLIGTDLSGGYLEEDNIVNGEMADFLMLVVVDKTYDTYRFVPVNRDTMTGVEGLDNDGNVVSTMYTQICTAHYFGNSTEMKNENTVRAVSNLFGGMDIDYYYQISMEDISKFNEFVNGVTVTIQDDLTADDPTLIQGETITLNNEQAYNFLHSRMNVADGTNVNRMNRQKQYMSAYFEKVKVLVKENPEFGNDFWNKMNGISNTNMNGNQVSKLMNILGNYENKGTLEISGELTKGRTYGDEQDYIQFIPARDSIIKVLRETHGIMMSEFYEDDDETEDMDETEIDDDLDEDDDSYLEYYFDEDDETNNE